MNVNHQNNNFFNTNKHYFKGKIITNLSNYKPSSILNINKIQNKIKNIPFEKNQNNQKILNNKSSDKKIKVKLNTNYTKKRSVSYSKFMQSSNNCSINNILSSDGKSTDNSKQSAKNFSKFDIFQKNKMRRKMMLSVSNSNYNNITSVNNDISQFYDKNNLTAYHEASNSKNNYLKNNKIPIKIQDPNSKKSKILYINFQNGRKSYVNSNLIKNNHNHFHQLQKRKYNNSQNNINFISNKTNQQKYFNTSYLFNNYSDNKEKNKNISKFYNDIPTIMNNSQKKVIRKENSVANLASSLNSSHYFNLKLSNSKIAYNNGNKNLFASYGKKITKTENVLNSTKGNILNNKLNKDLKIFEDELIKNLKYQDNKGDKNIRFKLIKNYFMKFLKLLNEPILDNIKNIIEILFLSYNELLSSIFVENKLIKEQNKKIYDNKLLLETEVVTLKKIIKEKQNKIDLLQRKYFDIINEKKNFDLKIKKSNTNCALSSDSVDSKNKTQKKNSYLIEKKCDKCDIEDEQNKKLFKLNQNNLDDLDALYFFDKIKMLNKNSFNEVPSINIMQLSKRKMKKKPKPKDAFNLIKQAFESDDDDISSEN